MADIVFVLIAVAFFAVCLAYVRGCERIIGSDPNASGAAADSETPDVSEVTVVTEVTET